jgi:glycyl-tRNA synthetase
MAEIEHFCDPNDKAHPKFQDLKDYKMLLYSACQQMDGKSAMEISIGEAVGTGLVANETLGYFMARIHQFLIKVGILPERLRFRQHMNNEMAHYACDCWDAECLTSYGWIECVGCADRSAYDLTQHTNATGVKLAAEKKLPAPKQVEVTEVVPNNKALGQAFKKDAKVICELLQKLKLDDVRALEKELQEKKEYKIHLNQDTAVTLNQEMVSVKTSQKTVHVEEIIPSVIEPSFGIGRIMYALLEHRFNCRDGDEQRCYFSLPPLVAPLKCSVLPLSNNQDFVPFVKKICEYC